MTLTLIHPDQLRAGDVLPGPGGYTCLSDAWIADGLVQVKVRYAGDGGEGIRHWDHPCDIEFQVQR